jgi:hypothetical protein
MTIEISTELTVLIPCFEFPLFKKKNKLSLHSNAIGEEHSKSEQIRSGGQGGVPE